MKHLESTRIEMDLLGEVGRVPRNASSARASLEDIRSQLDRRVLARLRPAMSSAQRDEFDALWAGQAEHGADRFLDRSMPGHREVADEELAKLKDELSVCHAIDQALADVAWDAT